MACMLEGYLGDSLAIDQKREVGNRLTVRHLASCALLRSTIAEA